MAICELGTLNLDVFGWAELVPRRHTDEVRHTVREGLRGISGPQAALALSAVAIMFILVSVGLTVLSGDDGSLVAGPSTTAVSASVAPEPLETTENSVDGPSTSVLGMVAGFGLIGLWLLGGGITLVRAQRGRSVSQGSPSRKE